MIKTTQTVEGLTTPQVVELEARLSSGVYAKRDLVIARGQGALLFDEQGRGYIDCVGGQGVSNLGHAHPAVAAAIAAQASALVSCPEMFYNRPRALFMERLLGLTGLSKVFLCNSGTEAVEAALKFARAGTARSQVIAAMRGFHGRTFGALSATWNKKYREGVEPLVPGFTHVPYNNLDSLAEAISDETAAVILEVVQGEGGVYPGEAAFLQGAQVLCQKHGAMLILDEVQTGFGRTGRMFAYQHYGLQPDLLCVAKSIAGGIPMGAVLIGERLGKLSTGLHGSTFGGNPLACAAGLASLEAIESEGLVEHAAEMGAYLMGQLSQIDSPLVREVRGLGLMVGIEIKQKVAPYLQSLMEMGVLALPAGMTVIRLLPPLVITQSQIDRVVIALQEILAA
jgi:acetylornithine/LysW-gamma-L-lysine aminotransferase